uniref:Secreted protein n=1 Tax=Anguilla anguilla TaxID=7936 RepID=A0A0E9TFK4_ANGAN
MMCAVFLLSLFQLLNFVQVSVQLCSSLPPFLTDCLLVIIIQEPLQTSTALFFYLHHEWYLPGYYHNITRFTQQGMGTSLLI